MRCLWTALTLSLTFGLLAWADDPVMRLSAEGRFLYSNDDDWDWATPAGARERSRLSIYGHMSWSALDWMEEGLTEVRGLLIGTPPETGNYLTMADLNRLRRADGKRSYEQVPQRANILRDLLKDKRPPNLLIFMQDVGRGQPPITEADVAAGLEFVRRGGRLMLLDDWRYYESLGQPFLEARHFPARKVSQPAPGKKSLDPASLKKQVLTQVELLASPAYAVREKATAELLKLGPAVLPLLRAIQPDSVEQERRINLIVQRLTPSPAPQMETDWVGRAYQQARVLHRQCELRPILRNAQQQQGAALCLRVPVSR